MKYINLNKSEFICFEWEQIYQIMGDAIFDHFYKTYLIFVRGADDSLIQLSGSNIFEYIRDKFGKATVYE